MPNSLRRGESSRGTLVRKVCPSEFQVISYWLPVPAHSKLLLREYQRILAVFNLNRCNYFFLSLFVVLESQANIFQFLRALAKADYISEAEQCLESFEVEVIIYAVLCAELHPDYPRVVEWPQNFCCFSKLFANQRELVKHEAAGKHRADFCQHVL